MKTTFIQSPTLWKKIEQHAAKRSLIKDVELYQEGDPITMISIVLSGVIEVSKYDIYGNKIIVTMLQAHDVFGESIAISNEQISPFNIRVSEDCELLQITPEHLFAIAPESMSIMVKVMAEKNVHFAKKVSCISQNTIRKRIFEYFRSLAIQQRRTSIIVPFNKSRLAAYLCVDRSSLSRELSKLEQENLLISNQHSYQLCGSVWHLPSHITSK
ncbi:MAG: Crp/Fnr family transcriptional regulator [Erysipelotrichaceae bacterium]